jgi:hypothetical protein
MFLGITLLGWMIIAVVYLPLLAVLDMWRGKRAGVRGTLVLFGVALLPLGAAVGEALYVDLRFQELCKTGGVEVIRRVETDGYFDGSSDWTDWPQEFLKTGFRYIEWKDRQTGRYRRIVRTEQQVHVFDIPEPTARYRSTIQDPAYPTPVAHLILRKDDTVRDVETDEILGRRTIYYRYPAFVDRTWSQFFDSTPFMCPRTAGELEKAVIVPSGERDVEK